MCRKRMAQRMAGHMGDRQVTVKNLEVVDMNTDRGLLFVRGAVPGAGDGLVKVRRSKPPAPKLR